MLKDVAGSRSLPTASPDSVTSVTCAQCEPAFICEEHRAPATNLPILVFSGKCQASCTVLGCEHNPYLWTSGPHTILMESVSNRLCRHMHICGLLEVILQGSGSAPPVSPCTKAEVAVLLLGCCPPTASSTSPSILACLLAEMSSNSVFYGLFFACSTVFYQLVLTEKPATLNNTSSWFSTDDGCGQPVLSSDSGLLYSKNYPGLYPNNSWCEWKIRVSSGLRIVLKFEDLSVEGGDCETNHLKVTKEIHGTKHVYWQYCGDLKANPMLSSGSNYSLYTDTSELTVSFRFGVLSSGRGFQLSYSTVDHKGLFSAEETLLNGSFCLSLIVCPPLLSSPEMLTCSDKGHSSLSKYRKYCPAGCGAVEGDVAGDVSQGYVHTSLLCKSAVHAGVILDRFGGPIVVEGHRGLRHCEAVQANGILSKCDSSPDSFFTFVTNDCNRQTILHPNSTSFSWEKNGFKGPSLERSSKDPNAVSPTGTWSADPSGTRWLQLDLGEKKRITVSPKGVAFGVLAKVSSDKFVRRYQIMYKEKSQWQNYTQYNNLENMVFEGNVSRSTFRPAIIARFLRVIPLEWPQGFGLTVELLGCPYVRTPPVSTQSQVTQEALPTGPKPPMQEADITSQADIVKLAIIVVPTVLCVVLLLLGICIYKVLHKKKTKENTYDSADPPQTGCWKPVKHPSVRHQSTEFTFSYSSEKDPLPKIDLVTSDMADYQQPLMLGVGTVSRKGSTFRPMDTDAKDDVNEASSHYDFLQTANQYALPLTNQEPEYATPIIERHAFRKDAFLPDPSYSVPGVVLSKSPSFKTKENANYRKVVVGFSGGYQTPQIKPDRVNHSEGVYDSPKIRKPLIAQNGTCSEYQRPQTKTRAQENYSTPRDCIRLDLTVPCRPDPEGSSLSGI
ncbi:hypothetical protein NFI96_014865 [Prochilodus magdalenae]|nr:hypothetical protein NFI96_014865 [Prochilodus magdalenae]